MDCGCIQGLAGHVLRQAFSSKDDSANHGQSEKLILSSL